MTIPCPINLSTLKGWPSPEWQLYLDWLAACTAESQRTADLLDRDYEMVGTNRRMEIGQ